MDVSKSSTPPGVHAFVSSPTCGGARADPRTFVSDRRRSGKGRAASTPSANDDDDASGAGPPTVMEQPGGILRPRCDVRMKLQESVCGLILDRGFMAAKNASTHGTSASASSAAVLGNNAQFVGSQVVRSMSTSVRQSWPYFCAESPSAAATQTLLPSRAVRAAFFIATRENSSRTISQSASSLRAQSVAVTSQNGTAGRPGT
mmetsp:Transcript_1083/g.3005  ORF Transcript_1083/g.3005 Transcript_1083/m.3005 type:complete len:203 (-) Transcript_1083:197-805(-)